MLQLKNITKDYVSTGSVVHALRGVDVEFGSGEFVAILGPSGCGKTTLLNIIGGLDRYTSGDLCINGKSTKQFRDSDWDSYRNHSIGFVFQSYNLIPHQTVLANVELALTLSGVSRAERHSRAKEALCLVGLEDQMNKKPNQLSGGQMQRVAIARALVNDPEIILADEPTGALDSETSVQVLELLCEIASDKLVIMVTHNAELASKYATRIVRLLDGKIVSDEPNPNAIAPHKHVEVKHDVATTQKKRVSMSFFTALSLSLNNLMTKKARTLLTAFAGSIGIIGIALILSISDGFQNYINRVQQDTLSSYPLSVESEVMDMSSIMQSRDEVLNQDKETDMTKVYENTMLGEMLSSFYNVSTNDLSSFKAFLESDECAVSEHALAIQYGYDFGMYVYNPSSVNGVVQVNPSPVFELVMGEQASTLVPSTYQTDVFEELVDNDELLQEQFDVIAGEWPDAYDEVVLNVDEFNRLTDYSLYTLGLRDRDELAEYFAPSDADDGEHDDGNRMTFTYEELMSLDLRLVIPSAFYQFDEQAGRWTDVRDDRESFDEVLADGVKLKVVGIIRPKEGAAATSVAGAVCYTKELTEFIVNAVNSSEIVRQQLDDPTVDVFTGVEFVDADSYTPTIEEVMDYIDTLPAEEYDQIAPMLGAMTDEQIIEAFKDRMPKPSDFNTYEDNLSLLGVTDLDSPSSITIYPADFAAKDEIKAIIDDYNDRAEAAGNDEQVISYTDYVGLLMSSVSTIIDAISYILIAFVSVSLVVSSIMIGVITNISVLERTKEIGILRAIGASKRDISRVFNAETLIIGFVSGIIGLGCTLVLIIPVNAIIYDLGGIPDVAALPPVGAAVLLAISMLLTFIAGLIPSRKAAKKDPVVALRTE